MPLYLGLDCSTQSLTAVIVEFEPSGARIVFESSLNFDDELPHYGTQNGVLPNDDPSIRVAPPLMWVEALDAIVARIAGGGIDRARIAAISGSAQQHGSVYLNASAAGVLASIDPARPLVQQIRPALARAESPIWMDSSTAAQCDAIRRAVGGDDELARRTGSRASERFTGPQIRKFHQQQPDAYASTDRIHLVSSFLASLLIGGHAPLDTGDASGMNLMDLAAGQWWAPALEATAPDLARRLPSIVVPWTRIGPLGAYWRQRYGFPAADVIVWSGDNPCSLIGTGLVREGTIAVSLGTSDTVFGPMDAPRRGLTGSGHIFGSPTGAFMGLTCFANGSLARERIRDEHGMTWLQFSEALDATPPGNDGRLLLPWFAPEITPHVPVPSPHRFGLARGDGPSDVRAVVEAQQMAMALHSRWIASRVDRIYATGGASVNRAILQVMADVFGADVYSSEVTNTAALGAALRARHARLVQTGEPADWDDIIRGLAEPDAHSRVQPDPRRHAMYQRLIGVYAACEAVALGRGPGPQPAIDAFRAG